MFFVTCIMLNSRVLLPNLDSIVLLMFCVSFTIANFANADSIAAKSRNVGVFSGRCG